MGEQRRLKTIIPSQENFESRKSQNYFLLSCFQSWTFSSVSSASILCFSITGIYFKALWRSFLSRPQVRNQCIHSSLDGSVHNIIWQSYTCFQYSFSLHLPEAFIFKVINEIKSPGNRFSDISHSADSDLAWDFTFFGWSTDVIQY